MDIALCTADGQRYEASVFADLDPGTLASWRHQLECISCNAEAYFRRASSSGQAACFGARPHLPGCELAMASESEGGLLADEDERDNSGRRFRLYLSPTKRERRNVADLGDEADAGTKGHRYTGRGGAGISRSDMRLMAALRRLVRAKSFRTSNSIIELPGGQEELVRNFFVQIDDVGMEMRNELRAYWGAIYNVGVSANGYWLNAKGSARVSFHIPSERLSEVLSRVSGTELEDLSGASILAYAPLRKSSRGDKLIIWLDDKVPFVIRHESRDHWDS